MQMLVHAEPDLPDPYRTQLVTLIEQAWPSTPGSEPAMVQSATPLHDPALRPTWYLLTEGDQIRSALAVLRKAIVHCGRDWRAAGLSTVMTAPEFRGQGLGSRLVTEVRLLLSAGEDDLGLFTCDRELGGFYRASGWELLTDSVLIGGTPSAPFPGNSRGLDKLTFGAFWSASARAARDRFVRAEIELFPGELDRLW